MIFSFQRPSHIAISDEKGGVRGISDERGNVRGYREGDDKTRVQLLKSALQQHLPPTSHIAISAVLSGETAGGEG